MSKTLSASWLLMLAHMRASLRSKRFLICLLVAMAPPLIALAAGARNDAENIATALSFFLILQVVAPIIGLVLGSAVITEEIEDRTISFVFTRPVPRASLFLGRYAATVLLVMLTLIPCSVALVLATTTAREGDQTARIERVLEVQKRSLGDTIKYKEKRNLQGRRTANWRNEDGRWRRKDISGVGVGEVLDLGENEDGKLQRVVGKGYLPINRELPAGFLLRLIFSACLSGAFYGLVTAGIGTLLKRPMIYGLGYAFAMEMVLANIPGSAQSFSVQYYLRGILMGDHREIFEKLDVIKGIEFLTPMASAMQLGGLMFAGILLASWIVSRRQYVLTS
ncbi:MAG: hypothetical protein ACI8QC_001144 [Planctomycetota bacterium]|jgi:hypothetical protein